MDERIRVQKLPQPLPLDPPKSGCALPPLPFAPVEAEINAQGRDAEGLSRRWALLVQYLEVAWLRRMGISETSTEGARCLGHEAPSEIQGAKFGRHFSFGSEIWSAL